jgi:hypothetical protein
MDESLQKALTHNQLIYIAPHPNGTGVTSYCIGSFLMVLGVCDECMYVSNYLDVPFGVPSVVFPITFSLGFAVLFALPVVFPIRFSVLLPVEVEWPMAFSLEPPVVCSLLPVTLPDELLFPGTLLVVVLLVDQVQVLCGVLAFAS